MKFKKGASQIIPIVIVIVVIVAGGIWYFATHGKNDNLGITEPKAVMLEVQKNSFIAGTQKSNVVVTADISNQMAATSPKSASIKEHLSFDLNISGATDLRDLAEPSFDLNIKLNSLKFNTGDSVATTIGPINLDFRKVGKTQYIRLNQGDLGFVDLSSLIGKWLSIDQNSVEALTGLPQAGTLDTSETDKTKIAQAAKSVLDTTRIYDVLDTLPDENISGVDTFHYKLGLNKEGINKLIAAIAMAMKDTDSYKKLSAADQAQTDASFVSIQDIVTKMDFSFMDIDMWVSKSDLVAVKTSVVLDMAKMVFAIKNIDPKIPQDILGLGGTIKIESESFDIGKNQNITAPTDAEPLEQVLQQMFGAPSASKIPAGAPTTTTKK